MRVKQTHLAVLAMGMVVVLSLGAVWLIWHNVRQMEREHRAANRQLSGSIAETSEKFMKSEQPLYFYELLSLLTKIAFVDYMEVNVNGGKFLDTEANAAVNQAWIRANSRNGDAEYVDRVSGQYYVNQALDSEKKQNVLTLVFSEKSGQKPVRIIRGAIGLIIFLLVVILGLVLALVGTLSKLEAARRNKAATIHSITHDARQDLTVIQGKLTSVLRDFNKGKHEVDIMKNVKAATESTVALDRFLHNLNDQQRMEQGRVEMLFRKTDIRKTVDTVASEFEENLALRTIRIVREDTLRDVMVWADPHILKRIIQNLVHNAMKYSGNGKTITLWLLQKDKTIRLEVRDQGIGIDRALWEKVFEANFQVNAKSEGMGLGLNNARALARQMAGEVGILESAIDQGTVFFMDMPVYSDQSPVAGKG